MSKSKIALVTGGSRGLGRNMALSLAKEGIDVILTYNSRKIEALAVVDEIVQAGQKLSPYSSMLVTLKASKPFLSN